MIPIVVRDRYTYALLVRILKQMAVKFRHDPRRVSGKPWPTNDDGSYRQPQR